MLNLAVLNLIKPKNMKNLIVAIAFIGFMAAPSFALTTDESATVIEFCEDGKKCDKKNCKHKKKSCKKGDKKACCSKDAKAKKACCSKDAKGKSCKKKEEGAGQ